MYLQRFDRFASVQGPLIVVVLVTAVGGRRLGGLDVSIKTGSGGGLTVGPPRRAQPVTEDNIRKLSNAERVLFFTDNVPQSQLGG